MAGQYRFKDQSGNIVAQISGSVGGAITFSGSLVDFSQANNIILGNVQLAGTASNALLLDGFDSQAFAFTSSIHPFTASIAGTNTFTSSATARLNSIETISASNVSRLNSLEIKTGSLATTGSNTFIGTQTITGSLYISSDLIVQGSSSLQNITASAVSIGTNIINLNTANPAIRYAGLSIGDSGSIGSSGSFLYDSVQDEMIFIHRGTNTTVTSSVLLMGPQTYDNIGNEIYPTSNYIQKGTGNEHLVDSCIVDNGTTVCVNTTLKASGQVCGIMGIFSCIGIGTSSPTTTFEVSSTDLNNIFVTNPTTTGTTTGSGIGFKAYNGTSVAQAAGIILTSNTWNYGTYSANQLSIGSDGTGGIALRTANSAPISFFTGCTTAGLSAERMRITSGGLVSINQTCGYGAFNVTGIDCSWGEGIVMNPAPNGYNAINFRAEGRTGACFTGTWQLGKISSGETSSGEVFSITRQGTTGGTAYRADASQQWKTNGDSIFGFKVGIGTSTPDYLLTVDGQVANFSTVNLARFYASKGQTEAAYLQIQGTRHSTSGVRRMVLDAMDGGGNNANLVLQQSGGGVLVNTTTNSGYGVFNTYKLPVSSNYVDQIIVQGTGNYPSLRLGTYDAYDGVVATTGNDLRILAGLNVTTENHSIRFYTSFNGGTTGAQNYERMRIEYNGAVLIGAQTTSKGLLRVAGNAEICKTMYFNGGDGLGGAIINAGAVSACATPAYNLISMFGFNSMTNYGAYLFIHTGYNTVTTKNSTITGIVNNGGNQTISILATTLDSGATAPSVHSTSNWCIAFCWPNPANSNTKFIALAG